MSLLSIRWPLDYSTEANDFVAFSSRGDVSTTPEVAV